MMRTGRIAAAALGLCLALPAFAQQSETDDTAAPAAEAPSSAPAPSKRAPQRTRAAAPAKPIDKPAAVVAPRNDVAPAAVVPGGKPSITAENVRPPADMLIDCAKAPKDAVTKLPDNLAKWATIYCTRLGNIFNANDTHFGAFPDSGLRASFNAADLIGKTGEVGNDAYFTSVAYRELTSAEGSALIALDPSVQRILVGKSLWRLDLAATGGANLSFLVINPSADPFWVFPLDQKGVSAPAFYVTSLDALNRAR